MAQSSTVREVVIALVIAGAVLGLYVAIDRPFEDLDSDSPRDVAVADLWASPEVYQGDMVRTSGLLRVFHADSPQEHFTVEDDEQYRVGLRGAPADEMSSVAGQRVTVVGKLGFSDDFGVYIDVVSLSGEGQ